MPPIRLSWTPNPESQLVHAYHVFELSAGNWNFLASTPVPEYVYTPNAGQLSWKVRAVNFVGESGFSPVADGPGLPSAPGTITVEVV
jgi:hypothetical protein